MKVFTTSRNKNYEIKIVIMGVTVIYLQESKVHHLATSRMPQHLRYSDKLHDSPHLSMNLQIPLESQHLLLSTLQKINTLQ